MSWRALPLRCARRTAGPPAPRHSDMCAVHARTWTTTPASTCVLWQVHVYFGFVSLPDRQNNTLYPGCLKVQPNKFSAEILAIIIGQGVNPCDHPVSKTDLYSSSSNDLDTFTS